MPLSEKARVEVYIPDLLYALSRHLPTLSTYADELRNAAFLALNEEAILVTVTQVYHS